MNKTGFSQMNKSLLLTVCCAIFLTGLTNAQQVRKITLQEAIQISLENNYQLKQAENNLGLAEDAIMNEYADFLPSASATFRGSRQVGRQPIEVDDRQVFIDVTSRGLSGSISSGITLFNGFENINSLRRSQESKLSREESLQRAKENVIFNTSTRFLQVLLDQQLLEIALENLETSKKQLEQVKAQVEVGSRPAVDLYNQESQVANDELTVTQRENTKNLNELLLVRQLQIDPLGNYEFVTPDLNDENLTSAASFDIRTLINQALDTRSDIKSEEANINSLSYTYKMARANLLPSLTASWGINTSYGDQFRGGGISFNDQFFDQRISRSLGFSLSLPIFNNWDRMYNIQSAQVNLKNAELSLENTELQVVQEVTQAYNDYTSYEKQLEAADKALIASEKAFETQQERYNVGASTLIELSQAQANYVQAQSDRTQALYNLIFQVKLLDYYLGKLSGTDIEF